MMVERFVIYGLCDPRDGQLRYIGKSAKGVRERVHLRTSELRRRCHRTNWLNELVAQGYTPDAVLIETHASADTLSEAEQHYIGYFRSIGCNLTNATAGGDGVMWGRKHSAQTRLRLSEMRKGHPVSEETRNKIRAYRHTPEARERIAQAKRGLRLSDETKRKISATKKRKAL